MDFGKTINEVAFAGYTGLYYQMKQELEDTRVLMNKIEDPNYKMNNYDVKIRQRFEDFFNALKKTDYYNEELLTKYFSPSYKKLLPSPVN